LVDRLREAPSRLATYVKHLAKSIPNQVLAFMKSYFPKAPVDVVAGGLAANCTDEQYAKLLEQMAPLLNKSLRSSISSSPVMLARSSSCT
jgi:chromosome condensin MukBEF complex kleisin-like MukF subunit